MPATKRRPTAAQLERQCEKFNEAYPVGTAVQYFSVLPRNGDPGSPPVLATIRDSAFVLSGHSAVAFLDGVRGCVSIEHVLPAPLPAKGPSHGR